MPEVIVAGAGVVGLTAAIRLLEAGVHADIVTREPPGSTTSAVAAALWYPYRAFPRERVAGWSARGFEVLSAFAELEPSSGVRMRWGSERVGDGGEDPWWREAVPTFERTTGGWRFEAPVADMSMYLPWLVARVEALGGSVVLHTLGSLDEALERAPVVVNCTGLGARGLAGDDALLAVRGQVLYVEQSGVEEWLLDQSDPEQLLYIVPRERDVVLGGTAQQGDEDRRADAAVAAVIRARCEAAVPALRGARVIGEAVGLRPARPAVRLEAEAREEGTVVHCYGHGGAGVTLAWGCADEVATLVARSLG